MDLVVSKINYHHVWERKYQKKPQNCVELFKLTFLNNVSCVKSRIVCIFFTFKFQR